MPLSDPLISIIIPTLNEEQHLKLVLAFINDFRKEQIEIIISDGGSSDNTIAVAQQYECLLISSSKGRAVQMNKGARVAKGDVLYFLHADSIPPKDWLEQIKKSLNAGFVAGCFRLQFDWQHWFLKSNAWFTKFSWNALRFGDQSLFVTKSVFEEIGGFSEDHFLMEDQEIVCRITKKGKLKVMSGCIVTSARKYRKNGPYRMQAIFFYIYFAYVFGVSQSRLTRMYQRLIRT